MKPTLVIMAAGMGSRYGGLKQIDPVDAAGHLIIDFSIYDAIRAGFERIVFIIKHHFEDEFRELIGDRIAKKMEVAYVYQETDTLPEGYQVPKGREKPWGTAHAILCCKPVLNGPFAVINADDYYGIRAFQEMYQFLAQLDEADASRYAMIGYQLEQTLTDHGHVARGICQVSKDDLLTEITERTQIERQNGGIAYTEDNGNTWTPLPGNAVASMNLWGFGLGFMDKLEEYFKEFLNENLPVNPLKCEFFLPSVVNRQLEANDVTVQVLYSPDRWYGVTYQEDKQKVVDAVIEMKRRGLYPDQF